jgi:PadR family transcriptional regulator PadR
MRSRPPWRIRAVRRPEPGSCGSGGFAGGRGAILGAMASDPRRRRRATPGAEPGADAAPAPGELVEDAADATTGPIASGRDESGQPVHRGWAPMGGRRRWMEPFVLAMVGATGGPGYALQSQLDELGLANGAVDVGQVYRTLRDLEEAGQVVSTWSSDRVGPQRRDYVLTETGFAALHEWAAVMRERTRLIAEFDELHRRVHLERPG